MLNHYVCERSDSPKSFWGRTSWVKATGLVLMILNTSYCLSSRMRCKTWSWGGDTCDQDHKNKPNCLYWTCSTSNHHPSTNSPIHLSSFINQSIQQTSIQYKSIHIPIKNSFFHPFIHIGIQSSSIHPLYNYHHPHSHPQFIHIPQPILYPSIILVKTDMNSTVLSCFWPPCSKFRIEQGKGSRILVLDLFGTGSEPPSI